MEARKRLVTKVQALHSTSSKALTNLIVEIQTLRVTCMLLKEAEPDAGTDPNTYREMAMLNRMVSAGGGPDDDLGTAADELLLEQDAAARLERRGISRASIPAMVRILSAVSGRVAAEPVPDDDEGDEPEMVDTPKKH